jgi:Flp pilus assembly protein TadG
MNRKNSRHGIAIIYTIVTAIAVLAVLSLAVDFARVELVKTQLQRAADAAARYGASGLSNIINGTSAAYANAVAAAAENKADNASVVLDPTQDIKLIIWNSATGKYTITTDPTLANGVWVNPVRSSARGNAVPLMFASLTGNKGMATCDIKNVTSIAVLSPAQSVNPTVLATGNPFLAGMPAGSQASVGNPHNDPDVAGTTSSPKQSPLQANIPFSAGQAISFDGVVGGANNQSSTTVFTADGNLNDIETNYTGNDNNMGNINAPLNSLVGVFLDNSAPNTSPTPTPALVDYSNDTQRNFQSISPPLKQIFFIGDGRTDDGQVQQFIPPAGATRLFLATWDGYEWSNNVGSFSVTVHLPGTVTLVK